MGDGWAENFVAMAEVCEINCSPRQPIIMMLICFYSGSNAVGIFSLAERIYKAIQ